MFEKILIANRGEIACRVIKTARKMGIKTVAIYSDADKHALHVQMADEAVHIGPPPANQSYIVIDKVMDAIKQTGAQAVHPGYGFLSENSKFAEALEAAGVAFIGPPKGAIEAMGDKITSKKIAQDANVSTVPGYMGLIEDADEAVKISNQIGYPVMIKASAGGGGKGMRIAWNDTEAREGFQSSKNEAANSFGDDRIFIEKFVTQPRHIEIQVLCDAHGNGIYLNERECSIQRRNQKVVEEAPSPFLDEATRKAMGEQSVALAKAVGYTSAGTVEFIVDGDKNFYFLEMNTRLQVEHPVTELITGVDLVEQMIRAAGGEPLSITQADVGINGWAIENRVYAEDPYRNFLPSIGRLTRYRPPVEVAAGPLADNGKWQDKAKKGKNFAVRNDTGVYEGGEISMYYDPMIAKLCTWAPTRGEAIEAMRNALDGFELEGIGHNLPFVSAVMDHPKFISGDMTTAFIAEEYPDGFEGVEISMYYDPMIAKLCTWGPDRATAIEEMRLALDGFEVEGIGHNLPFLAAVYDHPKFISGDMTTAFIAEEYPEGFEGVTLDGTACERVAAAAAAMHRVAEIRRTRVSGRMDNHERRVGKKWVVSLQGQEFAVKVKADKEGSTIKFADGGKLRVTSDWTPGDQLAVVDVDGPLVLKVGKISGGFRIRSRGADLKVHVRTPRQAELARLMPEKLPPDTSKMLLCPMPGLIVKVDVAVGDEVQEGQALCTVEAMKMENILRAEKTTKVTKINAGPGDSLAVDDVIMEFE